MTVLDDKLVPKTLEIIKKFGKKLTFTTLSTQAYDPDTGDVTEGGSQTFEQLCSPPAAYERRFVDGETVKDGDMRTLVPASGLPFTIKNGLKVEFDGTTWAIVSFSPLYSGDLRAAYRLQLRQ